MNKEIREERLTKAIRKAIENGADFMSSCGRYPEDEFDYLCLLDQDDVSVFFWKDGERTTDDHQFVSVPLKSIKQFLADKRKKELDIEL